MKISLITDEATQSMDEAIGFALKYGLQGLELRSVTDRPIDRIPVEDLKTWHKWLEEADLSVPCISGSFFKCISEESEKELKKLARLCDVADVFGCSMIRGFAFFCRNDRKMTPEELRPFFSEPERLLRSRGKRLLLEADPSVNTTNHRELAALLDLLPQDVFGAVYDPGNDLFDPLHETPYPDGYLAIKPYCVHIHVKDAIYENGEPVCVAPGEGLVGWGKLIGRLQQDGYEGWLSLEPHYRKNVALTAEQMRLPQGNTFSEGGMEAAAESALALQRLLRKGGVS